MTMADRAKEERKDSTDVNDVTFCHPYAKYSDGVEGNRKIRCMKSTLESKYNLKVALEFPRSYGPESLQYAGQSRLKRAQRRAKSKMFIIVDDRTDGFQRQTREQRSDTSTAYWKKLTDDSSVPLLPLVFGDRATASYVEGWDVIQASSSACFVYGDDFTADRLADIIAFKLEEKYKNPLHITPPAEKSDSKYWLSEGHHVTIVHPFESRIDDTQNVVSQLEQYLSKELCLSVFCYYPSDDDCVTASPQWPDKLIVDLWGEKSIHERVSEICTTSRSLLRVQVDNREFPTVAKSICEIFHQRTVRHADFVKDVSIPAAQNGLIMGDKQMPLTSFADCPVVFPTVRYPIDSDSAVAQTSQLPFDVFGQLLGLDLKKFVPAVAHRVFYHLFQEKASCSPALTELRRKTGIEQTLDPTLDSTLSADRLSQGPERLEGITVSDDLTLLPEGKMWRNIIQDLITWYNDKAGRASHSLTTVVDWSELGMTAYGMLEQFLRETCFQCGRFNIDTYNKGMNTHNIGTYWSELKHHHHQKTGEQLSVQLTLGDQVENITEPQKDRNFCFHGGVPFNQTGAARPVALLAVLWDTFIAEYTVDEKSSGSATVSKLEGQLLSMPSLVNPTVTTGRLEELQQQLVNDLAVRTSTKDVVDYCNKILKVMEELENAIIHGLENPVAKPLLSGERTLATLFAQHRRSNNWIGSVLAVQLYNRMKTVRQQMKDLSCRIKKVADRTLFAKYISYYITCVIQQLITFCTCSAKRPSTFISFFVSTNDNSVNYPFQCPHDSEYAMLKANPKTMATRKQDDEYVFEKEVALPQGAVFSVLAVILDRGKVDRISNEIYRASVNGGNRELLRKQALENGLVVANISDTNIAITGPRGPMKKFLESQPSGQWDTVNPSLRFRSVWNGRRLLTLICRPNATEKMRLVVKADDLEVIYDKDCFEDPVSPQLTAEEDSNSEDSPILGCLKQDST